MTQPAKVPSQEAIDRSVARLREACEMLDALNTFLDDAIAQVAAENRRSPLYLRRLERAKKLLDSHKVEETKK